MYEPKRNGGTKMGLSLTSRVDFPLPSLYVRAPRIPLHFSPIHNFRTPLLAKTPTFHISQPFLFTRRSAAMRKVKEEGALSCKTKGVRRVDVISSSSMPSMPRYVEPKALDEHIGVASAIFELEKGGRVPGGLVGGEMFAFSGDER